MRSLLLALLLVLPAQAAVAQQILIDHGARVAGLWVFPSAINPLHYYYVPSTARLVIDEQGDPHFSFMRYVINRPSKEPGSQGITQAEGGGVLHFLVTYDTPQEQIRKAEQALKRMNDGEDEVSLRGPVIFKEGKYALVSSIINPSGAEEPQLLATGNAPVLEGSQIALSFELPPERATLLLESLKMATPDISLIFEMVIEGLSDAFAADLVIKWDDVLNHESFGASANVAYYVGLGADVESVVADLREKKAIEIQTRGANDNMEGLLDKVTSMLIDIMFERTPVAENYEQGAEEKGFLDQLSASQKKAKKGQEDGGGMSTTFGVSVGYKTKQVKKSGKTVMSMNHQSPVQRTTTIGFNVGDLWSRYGDDPRIFKTVNLADAAFQQREIHVAIDGAILPEFDRYINSVTTVLKKQHQDGKATVQEIVIDRETFNKEKNDFRMIYGWSGDDDRTAWLRYDFRTRWSFKGGGVYETEWASAEANMIDLYAPYQRKVVKVFGDQEYLQEQGIRVVIVEIDYPFFEGRKKDKIRMRADKPIEDQTLELTLPHDTNEYHYKITWIPSKGKRIVSEGVDVTGIIFVDELPEPAAESEEVAAGA